MTITTMHQCDQNRPVLRQILMDRGRIHFGIIGEVSRLMFMKKNVNPVQKDHVGSISIVLGSLRTVYDNFWC